MKKPMYMAAFKQQPLPHIVLCCGMAEHLADSLAGLSISAAIEAPIKEKHEHANIHSMSVTSLCLATESCSVFRSLDAVMAHICAVEAIDILIQ